MHDLRGLTQKPKYLQQCSPRRTLREIFSALATPM